MIGDTKGDSKYIERVAKKIKREGLGKTRQVQPGDFLLTNSMSFGRPYILKTSGCIHDGWLVLHPKSDNLYTDYFYYCLSSDAVYQKLSAKAAGAVVKNLNTAIVKELEVPLPPLPIQKQIAALLEKADTLRSQCKQMEQELNQLAQSVFLEMFGNPVTNPKNFEAKLLEEIIDPERPITYGILKPGPDLDIGIPYVRVVDMQDGRVLTEQLRKTSEEIANSYKRSKLDKNDVLLSIRGHVGRIAITSAECVGANITQDTARLAPIPQLVDHRYLGMCLASHPMQAYMQRYVKGAAVKGINLGDVKKIPIPLPKFSEQHAFGEIVSRYQMQKEGIKQKYEYSNQLFASLMQTAFNGKLNLTKAA